MPSHGVGGHGSIETTFRGLADWCFRRVVHCCSGEGEGDARGLQTMETHTPAAAGDTAAPPSTAASTDARDEDDDAWLLSSSDPGIAFRSFLLVSRAHTESRRGRRTERVYERALDRIYARAGTVRDTHRGGELLQRAAVLGHTEAMLHLGQACRNGLYFQPVDPVRGNEWILKAANLGDPYAVARCYLTGMGAQYPQAEVQAKEMLEQREIRSPFDLFIRGLMYDCGGPDVRDDLLAVAMYEQAIEQGCLASQTNLAYRYQKGIGVAIDGARALRMYTASAEHGDAHALFNAGVCYQRGLGVAVDVVRAAAYYERAAAQDDANACNLLGNLCRDGNGMTKDLPRAMALYRRAARRQHGYAYLHLGQCYQSPGYGCALDPERALYYFRAGARVGNSAALNRLHFWAESGAPSPIQ